MVFFPRPRTHTSEARDVEIQNDNCTYCIKFICIMRIFLWQQTCRFNIILLDLSSWAKRTNITTRDHYFLYIFFCLLPIKQVLFLLDENSKFWPHNIFKSFSFSHFVNQIKVRPNWKHCFTSVFLIFLSNLSLYFFQSNFLISVEQDIANRNEVNYKSLDM